MSDLISRQAAIDALDEQITQCDKALGSFDISMNDEYAVKVERASLKAYRETLNVLPSAQRDGTDTNVGGTISRQAALDALESIGSLDTESDRQYARTVFENLPSAPSAPQWIPCSEMMPEEETDVLVTRKFLGCKDGSHGWNNHIPPTIYVEVAQYFNGEWTALSDEYKVARSRHTEPMAWQPLPEPYRGGDT